MPLIPALVRQRQADLCKFKPSLVYRMNSRTGIHRETEREYAPNSIVPWIILLVIDLRGFNSLWVVPPPTMVVLGAIRKEGI